MTTDLLDYVLDTCKTHGYASDLRGEIAWLPGEAFITLTVSEPTPALRELAGALESEFEELGRTVHRQVRPPASGIRAWLARAGHRMFGIRMLNPSPASRKSLRRPVTGLYLPKRASPNLVDARNRRRIGGGGPRLFRPPQDPPEIVLWNFLMVPSQLFLERFQRRPVVRWRP